MRLRIGLLSFNDMYRCINIWYDKYELYNNKLSLKRYIIYLVNIIKGDNSNSEKFV